MAVLPRADQRLQTRRTRTAGKVDIPSVDDHVSKLEHMGRETVKKLSDIMDAAHQAGIEDLHVHSGSNRKLCIETVGAFQQLALAAENVRDLLFMLKQSRFTLRFQAMMMLSGTISYCAVLCHAACACKCSLQIRFECV